MDTKNVPIASDEADRIAINESPDIFELLFIFNTKNETIITSGIENSIGAIPRMVANATLPKATCDKPSPIMEYLLKTSDTPTKAAHSDNNKPTINALCMNVYENISIILSIMMNHLYIVIYCTIIEIVFF